MPCEIGRITTTGSGGGGFPPFRALVSVGGKYVSRLQSKTMFVSGGRQFSLRTLSPGAVGNMTRLGWITMKVKYNRCG